MKRYENLKKDNKKLSRDVELKQKNNMSYIDTIFDLERKIKEDQAKICNILNKFENNMEASMDNLDQKVTDEENKMSAKLNKLNDNIKKIDHYIKENNNKKVYIYIKN